jgi:protein SCO1/2
MKATVALLALALAGLPGAARAGLTQEQLAEVAVDPPPGAQLDLGLNLPTVLVFADFTCAHLCDAILAQTAAELADSGLAPGKDYALAVVGLDPRDDAAAGEAFVAAQVPEAVRPAVRLFHPGTTDLKAMTAALGYHFILDPEFDRFAHPAARYVLAADGEVTQVVPAFAADAGEIGKALALAQARRGVGGALKRLALYCYGYNATTGRYDLAIGRLLLIASLATVLIMVLAIGTAIRRERRRAG